MQNLLPLLKNRIPFSLYEELEFVSGERARGRGNKLILRALVEDAIVFLEESLKAPITKANVKKKDGVYYLNEDQVENFTLTSEPTQEGFLHTYHDIVHDAEVFRAENPLEQKGRVTKPCYLDNWPDFVLGDKRKTMGVDVARFGDDKSALVVQHGGHVIDIQGYFKQDTNATAGRVIDAINEHRPEEVIIDGTGGYGSSGLYDMLVGLGVEGLVTLTLIYFNGAPRNAFANASNARTEMYLVLQDKFRKGEITLPAHQELIEDLANIRFDFRAGKLCLEDKKSCKKRTKRSPDFSDALALAFYYVGGGLNIYY